MIVKDQNRACGFGASVVEFSMRADVQGGAFTPGQGSEIDVAALGRALWRHWGKILGLTLAVAAITLVGVNVVTPKYKSQALILIEGRENAFLRPEADKQTGAADSRQVDPEAVTSQVQILTSRDLARQVIKNLKLTDLPEFDPVKNGVSVTKVILSMLGLAKDPLSMGPEERALDAFYERLAVVPIEKSRVISIEFQSADPDLAAQSLRGYLTGSIDVVLRLDVDGAQRFLTVDYKTNWLGPLDQPLTAHDYRAEMLDEAMAHSDYPLQALLYTVVLHRFLRWWLPAYDPATHLGGVLYLYLRGMCGPDTPVVDGMPCGVFSWRPPVALVEELSDLLDGVRVGVAR